MERRFLSGFVCIIAGFFVTASVVAAGGPSTTEAAATQVETGKKYFSDGQFESALEAWNVALEEYRRANDTLGQARVLQNKAEAYLSMGHSYQAIGSLQSAMKLAKAAGDDQLATQVAGSLGTAYLLSNRTSEAKTLLEKATADERAAGRPDAAAVAGNNLGNLLASQGDYDAAIRVYQQAISDAKTAGNNGLAVKGSVNIARALVESEREKEALAALQHAAGAAQALPPSHEKAFVLISIGRLYLRLASSTGAATRELEPLAYQTLNEAAAVAESVGDDRAMSYAYGYLGALYEQEGRTEDAVSYTARALLKLAGTQAPEIRYRWEWQEARLLRVEGKTDEAINAYQRAVSDLQTIRPELVAGYMGRRSDFREETGQLYLDLADLLLKRAAAHDGTPAAQADLYQVRSTVELLKGAELADYFQDDCVAALKAKTTGIDSLGEHTAAIYPIILPDRLEMLVSLPRGMQRYSVPVGATELNEEVNDFRALLEKRTTNQYRRGGMKLFAWLIEPLEKDLEAQHIDTLVFVPDGSLRTIPLAALYDGRNFLIARYAVATIPGLTLTDPRPLPREHIKLLAAGLTDSVQGFPPLPNVAEEINQIHKLYDGALLENATFTLSNFEKDLARQPYSIVHVASHGKFQKDARNTFLLTYDGKLNMDTLQSDMASTTYREQPVELLTLSACQTAVGDDKAALGLGGVAVKAGARSALATLWYINDQSSSILITDFYEDLKKPGVSKARALQEAQIRLLKDRRYDHPGYWSPFLLIGNWL
jgi:CHAT domain-containing protein/Tfp pilus assembly protein PilF